MRSLLGDKTIDDDPNKSEKLLNKFKKKMKDTLKNVITY